MGIPLVVSITLLLGHQASTPDLFFVTPSNTGTGATERDIQQTLCARKILSGSPELGALNLIVRCRSGIVTVAGPVHDKSVMSKVVSLLEGLRGIEKIKNEMYVGPLGVRPLPLVANEAPVGQFQVETRRNPSPPLFVDPQSMGTLTSGPTSAERKDSSASWKGQPLAGVGTREPGLVILELIRAEPRFAAVRYSLNNGMVILEGEGGPEVTMEFAHRLAKIPGILGVRISQD